MPGDQMSKSNGTTSERSKPVELGDAREVRYGEGPVLGRRDREAIEAIEEVTFSMVFNFVDGQPDMSGADAAAVAHAASKAAGQALRELLA